MGRYINPFPQYTDTDSAVLAGAQIFFYESGTFIELDTFADPELTIPNSNPVICDNSGTIPDVYLQNGVEYRVRILRADNTEFQQADNITGQGSGTSAGGGLQSWSATVTYDIPDVVIGSDEKLYQSFQSNNLNNDPTLSPSFWTEVDFIKLWNTNEIYSLNIPVRYNNQIYTSLIGTNQANQPDESPNEWEPVGTGISPWSDAVTYNIPDVVLGSDGLFYQSFQDANLNNDPTVTPTLWSQVDYLRTWNTNETYDLGDTILYAGALYESLIASNQGNQPDLSPTEWQTTTSGQVNTIQPGTNITVDATDPINPVVAAPDVLPLAGGTMTGAINMQGNQVTFTGGGGIITGDGDVLVSYSTNGGLTLNYNGVGKLVTTINGVEILDGVLTVDEPSTDPSVINVRNSEGGVQISADGDNVLVYQTSAGSGLEDIWISMVNNGPVSLHNNAIEEFRTQDSNTASNTTGAQVQHHDLTFYDVGMNVSPRLTSASALTLTDLHVGKTIEKTAVSDVDITTTTDIAPDGSQWSILNFSGGAITIDATGVTLTWLDGDTGATGDRTLADNGACTIYKRANGDYAIWGVGLT